VDGAIPIGVLKSEIEAEKPLIYHLMQTILNLNYFKFQIYFLPSHLNVQLGHVYTITRAGPGLLSLPAAGNKLPTELGHS
jgi:hypothetical protein